MAYYIGIASIVLSLLCLLKAFKDYLKETNLIKGGDEIVVTYIIKAMLAFKGIYYYIWKYTLIVSLISSLLTIISVNTFSFVIDCVLMLSCSISYVLTIFNPFSFYKEVLSQFDFDSKAPTSRIPILETLQRVMWIHRSYYKEQFFVNIYKAFSYAKDDLEKLIKLINYIDIFPGLSKESLQDIKSKAIGQKNIKQRVKFYLTALVTILNACIIVLGCNYHYLLSFNNIKNGEINCEAIINSIYFILTIFTTTGFGDIYPSNQLAKLFIIFFYISNLVLLVGIISFFTTLIEEKINEAFSAIESTLEFAENVKKDFTLDLYSGTFFNNKAKYEKKYEEDKMLSRIMNLNNS
ncbi:potassium channel family protein [Spirosoma gilvum]